MGLDIGKISCQAHQGFHTLSNLAFKSSGALDGISSNISKILSEPVIDNADKIVTSSFSPAIEKQGDSFISSLADIANGKKDKKSSPLKLAEAKINYAVTNAKNSIIKFLSK